MSDSKEEKKPATRKSRSVKQEEELIVDSVAVNNDETKKLWVVIIVLGSLLTLIGLFAGFKIIGDGVKNVIMNQQQSSYSQHQQMLEDFYYQGYNDGYNQGYNDGSYQGQVPMYEDPCSYDYMLKYGYQPDCVYIPENEMIVPNEGMMIEPDSSRDSRSSEPYLMLP